MKGRRKNYLSQGKGDYQFIPHLDGMVDDQLGNKTLSIIDYAHNFNLRN